MKLIYYALLILLVPCLSTSHVVHSRQQVKISSNGIPYLLYLPESYSRDSKEPWPLILFLHGVGETGSDLRRVKKEGLPAKLEHTDSIPFIVVSPQCKRFHFWNLKALKTLVEEVVEQTGADRNRLYLTGTSMGGYATWAMAIRDPYYFAAIAPVCGGGRKGKIARIKHLPVWAFHGAKDRIVPPFESRRMVEALKAVGGDVRYTVYPGVGHKCWHRVYDTPELYTWFLSHRRQDSASASLHPH